ncbi:MAG: exonuclease domain-containing protein, partial [Flavobacteriaceae bacterium]
MYAIVDVETTGGKYNEEGITEIAIYRFDGHQIVDQFSSLVNPLKEIQPFVQRLTGINSKMLKNAPKFFEIAKRIVEITEDAVLVAHNAEFDYRIIQTEFRRLGFDFERQSLCTVDLSQKLIPNAPSFKLGQLVRSLGIPISDVHRAHGDAIATVELFKVLLEKDSKKEIISTHIKLRQKKKIPSKYLTIIDDLPSETGVYYIYNKAGIIIYIGKSKNIKKR